ncbi:MAG TPA: DUF5668 domain-containing protein [Chitinophagaceae bacterium]|jgi:predicted membrane protein
MDTEDQKNDYKDDYNRQRYNGRVWGGLFLLLLGGVYLLKELSFPYFPDWLFSWPMILILVGVFSGIRHNFRGGGWLVMLLIGGFFLVDEANIGINLHRYMVPFIIICVGLAMILRPRRRWDDGDWGRRDWGRGEWRNRRNRRWDDWGCDTKQQTYTPPPQNFSSGPATDTKADTKFEDSKFKSEGADDYLDSVSVFGGVRKVIMSKNFKGGEATSFMGGTELDFTQADINGTVVLELTTVMGGAKLIVPGNWSVRNQVNAVFGGVDDKRNLHVASDPNKILLLKGTSVLGGLEIRNY